MEIFEASGSVGVALQPGDVTFDVVVNATADGVSTITPAQSGVPQHIVHPNRAIVSFGNYRAMKQEDRNATSTISQQVYLFLRQNPEWVPLRLFVPSTKYIHMDKLIAGAIINPDIREHLQTPKAQGNLKCILQELQLYTSNKLAYSAANILTEATLLNNILNAYEKVDMQVSPTSLSLRYLDVASFLMDEIELMVPVLRKYRTNPIVRKSSDTTVMVTIASTNPQDEDIAAQHTIASYPHIVRAIVIRPLPNNKNSISLYNRTCYQPSDMKYIPNPNVKDLNKLEPPNSPQWRNNRTSVHSPKGGTRLNDLDEIWRLLHA